jgi:hypothetical protein
LLVFTHESNCCQTRVVEELVLALIIGCKVKVWDLSVLSFVCKDVRQLVLFSYLSILVVRRASENVLCV